jgi:MoCo/4Fe-4S cofactor protein with predicted Tat translocation signal
MKTIPPALPIEPQTGRHYWRSLDQLAQTPEFSDWVEREFPSCADELRDPVTRRQFMKLMSASFLLAGIGLSGTGCRRPEETIVPFGKMPEHYVHGVPQYYATAMPTRGSALPLLVKSYDGRPVKIEGNPQHPIGRAGTDTFAQASILNLYDPDRSQRFLMKGAVAAKSAAWEALGQLAQRHQAGQGAGLWVMLEQSSSPTRARLIEQLRARLPQARWCVYEPLDLTAGTSDAARAAFGQSVDADYRLNRARRILSLDCDFLGGEEDAFRRIQEFAQGRKLMRPQDDLNRLYQVESLMTLTGANADHRLRVRPSAVAAVAAAFWEQTWLAAGRDRSEVPETILALAKAATAWQSWVKACVADLWSHREQCVVMAGYRQPAVVHLVALGMNLLLGNIGSAVVFRERAQGSTLSLAELARALNAGEVDTLIILGGNPVYNAPADLDWAIAQRKAKTVVRLGLYEDETSSGSDLHLPAAHYLESWGDAVAGDGTWVPVQPLIAPLFDGVSELEVLARLTGTSDPSAYALVKETLQQKLAAGASEEAWRQFLHDGYRAANVQPVSAPANTLQELTRRLTEEAARAPVPPADGALEAVFHRDYSMDDGRHNNNGWLQEMPDPITKLTWENAVLVSHATATELQWSNYDLVEVEIDGRKVTGPAWIQPGMADRTLGLAVGYGRTVTGRVGAGAGYNAYRLRSTRALHAAANAQARKVGSLASEKYRIGSTQDHGAMEGRPIVREANLAQYRQAPDFAQKRMGLEAHAPNAGPIYAHPSLTGLHQWGMVVDLNSCVGCSACVLACQSENNIPIVGREQVSRGREMHWLRVDRYFCGDPDKPSATQVDDPQVAYQPMFCQHCENAPCENVCPVNATVHDEEGLNVMAYNRCVGTRYCSNNCPYKVRRFNFFDYNKRPITQLYRGPLAHRSDAELDLVRLLKNPEVTVRMRGVMEKCTYCVQRIEQAKIAQKIKAGTSAEVKVPDGTITPACAQACPADAMVFGDTSDPNSRVSQLKKESRNYSVLGFLDVKPRTTYLARIRNPNPDMPDYHEAPASLQEYSRAHENPFSAGEGHAGSPAAERSVPPEKGGH